MNRTMIASLAAAAVIGTTGGITLALNSGDDKESPAADSNSTTDASPSDANTDKPAEPSEGTSTDGSQGAGGQQQATVLYYADGAIHDGSKNVAVPPQVAAGNVRSLEAVQGGWLIVQADNDTSGDEYFTGTFVSESSGAWRIGEWRGSWDVSTERDAVVYGNGVTWHRATFDDRSTAALDVLDGPGKEPAYMEVGTANNGIAITADGLVTGWVDGKTKRLVLTDESSWSHVPWGPTGVDVPVVSPDGTQAIAAYPNPDYSPTSPVGDCLTGGPARQVDEWWKECQVGPASPNEPWSPSGQQLLLRGTSNDGPGTSWVRVVDPASANRTAEFDPTGLLSSAEWGNDNIVYTLSYDEKLNGAVIKQCDVGTEVCKVEKRVSDNAVLGSR